MSDKMSAMVDQLEMKSAIVKAITSTIEKRGDIDPRIISDELIAAAAYALIVNECEPSKDISMRESFSALAGDIFQEMETALNYRERLQ